MDVADFVAISPLLILMAGILCVTALIAAVRRVALTQAVSVIFLIAACMAVPFSDREIPRSIGILLVADGYAKFFTMLLLGASTIVALLSTNRVPGASRHRDEYFLLLLLATLGACTLPYSGHFASFFLGLELLSVSLYGLIGYSRRQQSSSEAALKYLVLAGASSAFLLFGMALVYAKTGSLTFASVASFDAADDLSFWTGQAMILVGVGFKLALVPFHLWTPDVYRGAPPGVVAFVATVSKGAVVALLMRYSSMVGIADGGILYSMLAFVAVASMLGGNILALLVGRLRALLAFSSVAHLGYLIVAILSSDTLGAEAVGYYLTAYFASMLLAFGVVTIVSDEDRRPDELESWQGLVYERPLLGAALLMSLLSLAGIPLTGGFMGKFYILAASVDSGHWMLATVLVVASAIGLYYYLRAVVVIVTPPRAAGFERLPLTIPAGLAVVVLLMAVVALGVYPSVLTSLLEHRSPTVSDFVTTSRSLLLI